MNVIHHYKTFFLLILLTACSADMNTTLSIKGYDSVHMKQHILEHPLAEISGICYDIRSNTFLAVNDEQGILYKLEASTYRIIDTFHFAHKGDYEEIQMLNDQVFVLRSDGKIYTMNYDGKQIANIQTVEYADDEAEFESFFIVSSEELILIPKKSKRDSKHKQTKGLSLNLTTGNISESTYAIHWSDLKTASKIQPSAISIHPVSKEIYVLVSIEKRLIVLDPAWKVLAEYELDVKNFPQPEGITFDAEANLYITNEAGDGNPTLITIPSIKKK